MPLPLTKYSLDFSGNTGVKTMVGKISRRQVLFPQEAVKRIYTKKIILE